jgi:competence protein ComEC
LFFGTLAAQLGTLPITAIMFKKISMVSLIVNIYMIPLSNITLAAGFIMVITSLFSSWLASVFASFNIALMFIQLNAVKFSAGLDFAFVETYLIDGFFLAVYFVILAILYTAKTKNVISRLIICVLIALNFYIFRFVFNETDKVQLTYLDVGNSNCTLIKMPQGTSVMINPGGSTDKYFSAERNIMPYLKTEGIGALDILLVNSMNAAEFKNLVYFVNHFRVGKVYMPVYYKQVFENKTLSEKFGNTKVEFISEPAIINKKGLFRLYIYYDKDLLSDEMMSELVYGEQSFIFNDSRSLPDDIINTSYLPDENALMVLKLSGAGLFDYNSADFIAKADPEFIVISSSERGRKKAAAEIFSRSLNESGHTVLKTSEQGALIFETDGYTTSRVDWK